MADIKAETRLWLHGAVMKSVNMAIWFRDKRSIREGMRIADSLARCPMTVEFIEWYIKAKNLVYRLFLPENRSYWRKSLPYSRNTAEYHNWRISCLNRDRWTCQECGDNKSLHVHHIKQYKDFAELRTIVKNGVTLCKDCHKQAHKRLKHGQ